MALSLELALRAAMLNAIETFLNDSGTAKLNILQTYTTLLSFSLTATPLGSAANDSIAVASAPINSTGVITGGYANRFTLESEAGLLALSGTISAYGGGGDLQVPSVLISAGQTQRLNALVLRMASNGALSIDGSLTFV